MFSEHSSARRSLIPDSRSVDGEARSAFIVRGTVSQPERAE